MRAAISDATLDRIIAEVEQHIRAIDLADYADGADDWAWVRVYPDGTVDSGRCPSPEYPESEHFGRVPRSLTVWTRSGVRPAATPYDGVFEWRAIPYGPYIGDFATVDYRPVASLSPERLGDLWSRGWLRFDLDRTRPIEADTEDSAERERLERQLREWADTGNLTAGE